MANVFAHANGKKIAPPPPTPPNARQIYHMTKCRVLELKYGGSIPFIGLLEMLCDLCITLLLSHISELSLLFLCVFICKVYDAISRVYRRALASTLAKCLLPCEPHQGRTYSLSPHPRALFIHLDWYWRAWNSIMWLNLRHLTSILSIIPEHEYTLIVMISEVPQYFVRCRPSRAPHVRCQINGNLFGLIPLHVSTMY